MSNSQENAFQNKPGIQGSNELPSAPMKNGEDLQLLGNKGNLGVFGNAAQNQQFRGGEGYNPKIEDIMFNGSHSLALLQKIIITTPEIQVLHQQEQLALYNIQQHIKSALSQNMGQEIISQLVLEYQKTQEQHQLNIQAAIQRKLTMILCSNNPQLFGRNAQQQAQPNADPPQQPPNQNQPPKEENNIEVDIFKYNRSSFHLGISYYIYSMKRRDFEVNRQPTPQWPVQNQTQQPQIPNQVPQNLPQAPAPIPQTSQQPQQQNMHSLQHPSTHFKIPAPIPPNSSQEPAKPQQAPIPQQVPMTQQPSMPQQQTPNLPSLQAVTQSVGGVQQESVSGNANQNMYNYMQMVAAGYNNPQNMQHTNIHNQLKAVANVGMQQQQFQNQSKQLIFKGIKVFYIGQPGMNVGFGMNNQFKNKEEPKDINSKVDDLMKS